MALIVEYHVVADMYPVGATDIKAGMLVQFSNGVIIPSSGESAAIIGIAGDSKLSPDAQTTAYSAEVTIGVAGSKRFTSNRVSDFYDETSASQKITVYNGGGKFWVSEDLITAVGDLNAGTLMIGAANGLWNDATDNLSGTVVGVCCGEPALYPSGVPGTDVAGSIFIDNAGTHNYWVPIICRI